MATAEMVRLYTVDHLTLRAIAAVAGISHPTVAKRLKKAGISSKDGEWVNLTCLQCGAPFKRPRCHWRGRGRLFCSLTHYTDYLSSHTQYRQWRHGQRLAREVVRAFFTLAPTHVVHHIDGNNRNNAPENLAVFACQADHMRFHRGGQATPLWSGLPTARSSATATG